MGEYSDYKVNYFGETLKYAPNIVYLVVYAIIFAYYSGMIIKSRYWFFNVTFSLDMVWNLLGF